MLQALIAFNNKIIEDVYGNPRKDYYWTRREASIAVKLLHKEFKIKNTWLRRNWVPMAQALVSIKKRKQYKKEGYSNFKDWVKAKAGISGRHALNLIKTYQTFEGTDVLNLAIRKAVLIIRLPEKVICDFKRTGCLKGYSLRDLDLMRFDEFMFLIKSLQKTEKSSRLI